MIEDSQRTAVIIAIAAIIGLEVWRRTLRHRAPGWVHVVTVGLLAAVAGGVTYAQWTLAHLVATIEDVNPADKATMLAQGISRAMNANAIAVACVILTVIVLAIATWRARHLPEGGPLAQTRS